MDVNALRTWGLVVSSVLMAGALFLSREGVAETTAPVMHVAQAQSQAAPVAFLVRFQGSGPIARAQARAARGQTASAGAQVSPQLARQVSLRGLCFDRFTVGAAEIVLRSCEPVAASERAAYQQQWVARLQGMRAVDYVDANATVSPERAG
jgi:hypothetical protein